MIHFLVHEKADTVGVATVDIKAGEQAQGLFMDTQEPLEMKALNNIPPWSQDRAERSQSGRHCPQVRP